MYLSDSAFYLEKPICSRDMGSSINHVDKEERGGSSPKIFSRKTNLKSVFLILADTPLLPIYTFNNPSLLIDDVFYGCPYDKIVHKVRGGQECPHSL